MKPGAVVEWELKREVAAPVGLFRVRRRASGRLLVMEEPRKMESMVVSMVAMLLRRWSPGLAFTSRAHSRGWRR